MNSPEAVDTPTFVTSKTCLRDNWWVVQSILLYYIRSIRMSVFRQAGLTGESLKRTRTHIAMLLKVSKCLSLS